MDYILLYYYIISYTSITCIQRTFHMCHRQHCLRGEGGAEAGPRHKSYQVFQDFSRHFIYFYMQDIANNSYPRCRLFGVLRDVEDGGRGDQTSPAFHVGTWEQVRFFVGNSTVLLILDTALKSVPGNINFIIVDQLFSSFSNPLTPFLTCFL